MMFTVQTHVLDDARWWFAGTIEGSFTENVVISPTIFDAYRFDTKKEAEEAAEELGTGWLVGEILEEGTA